MRKGQNIDRNKPLLTKRVVSYKYIEKKGDSWKIAYADFITALMAFFMLLWLLNSVPAQKLKNIAMYFEPTIGLLGKSSTKKDDIIRSNATEEASTIGPNVKGFVYGVAQTGEVVSIPSEANSKKEKADEELFDLFENSLKRELGKSQELQKFQSSVQIEQTPEGLMIQINDEDGNAMFKTGTAVLTSYSKDILSKVVDLIKFSPNFIAVNGYTDKTQDESLSDYGKWELSAERANAARRFMVSSGIAPEKIARISAFADTRPFVTENPYDPRNCRISIILLRRSNMPLYKLSATKELIDFDMERSAKRNK